LFNVSIVVIENLSKSYRQPSGLTIILDRANFQLAQGEVISLVGPSGSGKTTLLQIIGLIDNPTSGSLQIAGVNCAKLKEDKLTLLRREKIGYIYQAHHLLPEFSAIENVMMPLLIQNKSTTIAYQSALSILTDLGLAKRINNIPSELSGGEQQRVAIARALVHKPMLLLADEPTGNLDHKNADLVMDLILSQVRKLGVSAIIVTHNLEIAKKTDRILTIKDQKIYNYLDVAKQ
jgi:lipoprotein-releasing system ATP-binding protein